MTLVIVEEPVAGMGVEQLIDMGKSVTKSSRCLGLKRTYVLCLILVCSNMSFLEDSFSFCKVLVFMVDGSLVGGLSSG